LVRWSSTVREVTNRCCAISRLVAPSAARPATRRSLAVSASRPVAAVRRGRRPRSRNSFCALITRGCASHRAERSSPARRHFAAASRWPTRHSSEPYSTRTWARSSSAGESARRSAASARYCSRRSLDVARRRPARPTTDGASLLASPNNVAYVAHAHRRLRTGQVIMWLTCPVPYRESQSGRHRGCPRGDRRHDHFRSAWDR
jgi:hypothetical protein